LIEWTHLQRRENPRIVDQHVDSPVFIFDHFDHFLDRCRVGDIGRHGQRLAAGLHDLPRHCSGLRFIELGDDGACTRHGE